MTEPKVKKSAATKAKEPEAAGADRAAQAETAPATAAGATDGPAGTNAEDQELKLKFREALERKQGRNAAGNTPAAGKDPSKAASAHGPAGGRRAFRRKSGG